jgi:methyltransferase (TIGR00027 family)
MLTIKPITSMAFYCCGVRMQDAASETPVCGDRFAEMFMCDYGMRIHHLFQDEENTSASVVVRHRIIDDLLRQELAAHPDTCIVTLGAGFDSRPYRLQGGTWVELDEPQVVSWKNNRLPAMECRNPLQRIAIDFAADSLEEKLAQIRHDGPVVVVVEGVFIYLSEDEIKQTISALLRRFPSHLLICDLVTREMVMNYGRTLHAKIQALGACFKASDHPETVFTLNGYRIRDAISIVERGVDFGVNKVPKLMLRYVMRCDVMGNAIYVFEPHEFDDDVVI